MLHCFTIIHSGIILQQKVSAALTVILNVTQSEQLENNSAAAAVAYLGGLVPACSPTPTPVAVRKC